MNISVISHLRRKRIVVAIKKKYDGIVLGKGIKKGKNKQEIKMKKKMMFYARIKTLPA